MEATTLFNVFYKIQPKSFDYCSVCLRTGAERRLVKPRSFKKFIDAIFLECEFNEKHKVCYMCERQAGTAYKFYEAAMFATTVKHFLYEYLGHRQWGAGKNYEKKRFRQLLKKKEPEWEYTAEQLEQQLQATRCSTELLQTEVLVIDSIGTETLSDVYIVPDEPHELLARLPRVPDHETATETVILSDEDEENQEIKKKSILGSILGQKVGPKLVPLTKLLDHPRIESTKIIFESDHTDPLTVAPPTDQLPTTSGSINATASSEFASSLPAGHGQLATSTDGLSTTNNIAPSSMRSDSYILHPIVLDKEGNLTVPSLGSNLINNYMPIPQIGNNNILQIDGTDPGKLKFNNSFQLPHNNTNLLQVGTKSLRVNVPMPSNTYSVIPQVSPVVPLPRHIATTKPNQMFQIHMLDNTAKPNMILPDASHTQADHLKQINELANEIISELKNNIDDDDCAVEKNFIYSSRGKRPGDAVNPVIQEVHSADKRIKIDEKVSGKAPRKSDRIDWEDKIPMDVISFMDAIDPNADQILNQPAPAQCTISNVRSLSTDKTRKSNRNVNNVIDLS